MPTRNNSKPSTRMNVFLGTPEKLSDARIPGLEWEDEHEDYMFDRLASQICRENDMDGRY